MVHEVAEVAAENFAAEAALFAADVVLVLPPLLAGEGREVHGRSSLREERVQGDGRGKHGGAAASWVVIQERQTRAEGVRRCGVGEDPRLPAPGYHGATGELPIEQAVGHAQQHRIG